MGIFQTLQSASTNSDKSKVLSATRCNTLGDIKFGRE